MEYRTITHKLSHQNLAVSFWEIEAKDKLNNAHSKAVIKELAVPVVIQNFIEKFFEMPDELFKFTSHQTQNLKTMSGTQQSYANRTFRR